MTLDAPCPDGQEAAPVPQQPDTPPAESDVVAVLTQTLMFRMDGGTIVPIPGRPQDCGPGSLIVIDCDEPNVHHVAIALRAYCKSPAHLNACDVCQTISWQDIKTAMQDGPHAVAAIRD